MNSFKRKFYIRWEVECYIDMDPEVIDRVDDEWRSALYNLNTPEEIAEHIAYNIIFNHWHLSQLDGWADMSDDAAKIVLQDMFALEERELTQDE